MGVTHLKYFCVPLEENYMGFLAEGLQLHLFSGSHIHCARSKLMLSRISQGFSSSELHPWEKRRFEGNSYCETFSDRMVQMWCRIW